MMPVVRVSDATFADLSALRTWFGTKTSGDTIDRVVRNAMERLGMERDGVKKEALRRARVAYIEVKSGDRSADLNWQIAKLAESVEGKLVAGDSAGQLVHCHRNCARRKILLAARSSEE